eukprot:s2207_g7.t1
MGSVPLRVVALLGVAGCAADEQSFLGQREGSLHCLGDCRGCYDALGELSLDRGGSAKGHTELTKATAEDIEAWLAAPEVCDAHLMFPVDIQRQAWSLAAAPEEYLRFRGAEQDKRSARELCQSLQLLSISAWQGARRSALSCRDQEISCLKPRRENAMRVLSRQWKETSRRAAGAATASVEISFAGNETPTLLQALASSGQLALSQAMGASLEELEPLASDGGADAALAVLAMELGRLARQVMEHSRTIWGLKQLALELSDVHPNIQSQLPTYRFQTRFYGRHFDVLERLLDGLEKQKGQPDLEIRMAELGVACGPMGLHLLARFPQLRYFGADPTIKDEVREAYSPYAARAELHATTSEEMHQALADKEPMDIVFVDGPHTYANVRNDLHLWEPRVKKGGIIAGHDFTVRHPPLLWAVSEYRMTTDGTYINLAMDGVWWWQVT